MRKTPSYSALLITEKSATYTIKWSYTIVWQARVDELKKNPKQGNFEIKTQLFYDQMGYGHY